VITKNKIKIKLPCVNWPSSWRCNHEENNFERLKKAFLEMGPITPDIALKLMNTLNFYNYVINNQSFESF
jgi:hypothetical protein